VPGEGVWKRHIEVRLGGKTSKGQKTGDGTQAFRRKIRREEVGGVAGGRQKKKTTGKKRNGPEKEKGVERE